MISISLFLVSLFGMCAVCLLALFLGYRIHIRLMSMFSRQQGIPEEAQTIAAAIAPLIPPQPERKKRFSVPLPGAEMFRKEKTQ